MSKKLKQDKNLPAAAAPMKDEKGQENALAAIFASGFERPHDKGWWVQIGGSFLAGIMGAAAVLVALVAVISGAFRGLPYLDRIDLAAFFPPTTPITISRTERVTVAADARTAEIVSRTTPALMGVWGENDLSSDLEGLLTSAGTPRAHAIALTSDGWMLAAGDLHEAQAGNLIALSSGGTPFAVDRRVQDPSTGLWFLKVDASALVATALRREAAALAPGTSAFLMQFRVGSSPFVTEQMVAGTVVLPYRDADKLEERIRFSRPVSGFFLGSPIVTMSGELAGIVSAVDQGGIVYAVPVGNITPVLDQVFKDGVITRPRTGIRYIELSQVADLAFSLTRGRRQGALLITNGTVPSVAPQSNAEDAGLKEGDHIIKVEGELVREESDLAALIQSYPPTTAVKLTVVRDGDERVVDVSLAPPASSPRKQ